MNQPTHGNPAPRIPLELSIEFRKSYSRASDNGKLTNISVSGAFIECGSRFDKNDKLNMTFEVGGRTRKIAAKVVWTNDRGAGIMFQHFNNRDLQLIDDLMYFVENSRESRRDVLSELFKKVS
jgi:hypothetical protein